MNRLEERIRAWNIVVENALETARSLLVFGTRGKRSVVLKVIRPAMLCCSLEAECGACVALELCTSRVVRALVSRRWLRRRSPHNPFGANSPAMLTA
jgi:hypothetical protein